MIKARKRAKIRKNDQVVLIAGRDKGKRGRVLAVAPTEGKVKIEGAGVIKRHQRAAGNKSGGIIDKESWINISNVQIVDPQSGKPSRVGYKRNADGEKFRVAAASGHSIEK
jgi:large subunit ribosomal protein L24